MPKNQFQRPLPVNHNRQVPRHGTPQPPQARSTTKPLTKAPVTNLPPLAALLDGPGRK